MRFNKLSSGILFVLLLGIAELNAQIILLTTGGNASHEGSIDYSIGQTLYTTQTGLNGSVTAGVNQPLEISIVTGNEINVIILEAVVYPNPTNNYVSLKLLEDQSNLSYRLVNEHGKILKNNKISSFETNIDLSDLAPAIYFLIVHRERKEIKSFRIIKN